VNSPDELAAMEFQSVPTSPAATGGSERGGASMMTKLSATLPSFSMGSGKETMAMGGTAEALKAKLKDGSSVRRPRERAVAYATTASAPCARRSVVDGICGWIELVGGV
jgi:hypothetical protein